MSLQREGINQPSVQANESITTHTKSQDIFHTSVCNQLSTSTQNMNDKNGNIIESNGNEDNDYNSVINSASIPVSPELQQLTQVP